MLLSECPVLIKYETGEQYYILLALKINEMKYSPTLVSVLATVLDYKNKPPKIRFGHRISWNIKKYCISKYDGSIDLKNENLIKYYSDDNYYILLKSNPTITTLSYGTIVYKSHQKLPKRIGEIINLNSNITYRKCEEFVRLENF